MVIYIQGNERKVNKMLTYEQMLDNIINQRGFEDELTIFFARLIENVTPSRFNDSIIKSVYEKIISK